MNNFFTNGPSLVPFKQIYAQNITPKLQEIDLFIKTSEAPDALSDVSSILQCSEDEVKYIMNQNDITAIQLVDFFTIVSSCSSYICRLISRQWKYVNFNDYTATMISDIYEINLHKVEAAFKDMQVETISEYELMEIFSRIHTPIYSFSNC
ncbi:MAG: hypothetical protein RR618_01010 [Cellulosilyticaceae bacterium]